ncbi:hypothetical protein ACWDBD_37885 [Streptomyces sp. NPDC001118]|uniref:hypothetical protein n=1 Tax=unclassified Streptomyces TaxID=2593676 RepID=UPI00332BE783
MRKFQRAAVVAAAVAGLSALGVGVSFAGGEEGHPTQEYTAVANSSANAVATYGGYNTHDGGKGHDDPAPEGSGGEYAGQGGGQ